MKKDFCRIQGVPTSSSFLYLFYLFINWYAFGFPFCFRYLLIDTYLVFISYFVSVPLKRGYRGSRISMFVCSFVPVSFCIFDYLYWGFWFFVVCLVTSPSSFAKTSPQSDIQFSGISEEQQRKKNICKSWSIQFFLNTRLSYNYLHEMIGIYW